MLIVRDQTDSIYCKAIHLQNEGDLGRIEIVTGEMQRITKLINTTIEIVQKQIEEQ